MESSQSGLVNIMETGENSYVWIFLNSSLAQGSPWGALTLLFLFFGRFLPIIALSPFFGSRILPHPTKVAFAICMFVIFLPVLVGQITTPMEFNSWTIVLILKEIFIGLVLGFLMSTPFTIVQNVGIIIDHQRGGASLMVNDPTIQNQSSPLGTLFNMVLIYIFYVIDGPFLFLDAIVSSYEIVPPDKMLNAALFNKDTPFFTLFIDFLNRFMVITLQLSAPALLCILMTDLFLGIANRLAPQVQITFLGMPLKSLLALAIICIGWQLFSEAMTKQLYVWLNVCKDVLRMFVTT